MGMKKTQAATEYIMVVGFVIVILLPGIYLYVRYSSESQDSVVNAKVDAISNEIIKAAEQVYSYGEGSQTIINVDFPEKVVMVEFQGREIIFTVVNSKGSQSEIAKVANADMTGLISVIPGTKRINIKSLGNSVSVFVECINDEFRCGSEYECNYYGLGDFCIMNCENNKWEDQSSCQYGCQEDQCIDNLGGDAQVNP